MTRLIRKAQRGEKDAFVSLIESYKTSLYRAAKAILKNDEDVADAMQDTVLEAWKSIKSLQKPEYFKTWLTRILIYKCYTILRRQKTIAPTEFVPELGEETNNDDTIDIAQAMQKLAENDRLILTLFYMDDLSTKQIAQMLSLSEAAVRTRLSRSRDRFKGAYLQKEAVR